MTTEEVLGELLTFFGAAPEPVRSRAGQVVGRILENPAIQVIQQSHESFQAAVELYLARPDKGYSLVDCSSMQAMRRLGIREALTNDRHFEQEGFTALFHRG